MSASVSVVITAFNEEKNLPAAVDTVLQAAQQAAAQVEILLVNDGSKDGTSTAAAGLAKTHPGVVRAIDHPKNLGIGAAFLTGLKEARFDRVSFYPGDGCVSMPTFRQMLKNADRAELVLSYTVNIEARTTFRRLFSSLFTLLYVTTFKIPLRYINATPVYPTKTLREMSLRCSRYSFPSEITIKLLRRGVTFLELQGACVPLSTKSSAVRLGNLVEVMKSYLRLVYEVYVKDRAQYGRLPRRVLPLELER